MKTNNPDATAPMPPTEDFTCSWCVIAGVEEANYPPDEFGGRDADTGKPICWNCAAEADAENYYEDKYK
jgi:hypothetical protein